jgi:ferrous iron transport protein B
VIRRGGERCLAFVKKAGTFILLSCAIIWFLSTYNWSLTTVDTDASMLADMGRAVCWIFTPLGWGSDWEFSVATITGLLAKENVVGTFGVLFGFEEVAENGTEIWTDIAAILTPLAGFSFLVFNLLCAPCLAAIGAMRSELGTWKATAVAVGYQCLFAYAVAMVVFGVGGLLIYGTFDIWTVTGLLAAAVIGYLLISKDPFRTASRAEAEAC